MTKIVFILNTLNQQRCFKRIEEFRRRGYQTDVYGFSSDSQGTFIRNSDMTQVIGTCVHGEGNYFRRLLTMARAIRKLNRRYQNEDVTFYYFLLDTCIAARLVSRKPYIYENSDLMYGAFPAPLKWLFRHIDRWLTIHSVATVMTSAGFEEYLFRGKHQDNVYIIPNKLNPRVLELPYHPTELDIAHLRFAFVGHIRSAGSFRFAKVVAERFPQHSFHLYGTIGKGNDFAGLAARHPNVVMHGTFQNPDDMPGIYEQVDVLVPLLSETNTKNVNNIYLEPNKLYESVYFRTPIVMTDGTYMARRVKELKCGFVLPNVSEEGITRFINTLTEQSLKEIVTHVSTIPQTDVVDDHAGFFEFLNSKLTK